MTLLAPPEFLEQAATLSITFDEGDLERLGRYLEMLLAANERFNLTAVTDPQVAWTRHVLDSLTLLAPLSAMEPPPQRVIDVGSGGGLPGIPLAIALPETRFTLLETTGKKASFLREAVAALGLANVDVLQERAETAGQDHHRWREQFDAVVARAVGPLPVLLELTVPFAKVGGIILCVKGEKAPAEVEESRRALHALHASVIDSIRTPTGTIVIVEKLRRTPRIYPRRPGEPKRAPL